MASVESLQQNASLVDEYEAFTKCFLDLQWFRINKDDGSKVVTTLRVFSGAVGKELKPVYCDASFHHRIDLRDSRYAHRTYKRAHACASAS